MKKLLLIISALVASTFANAQVDEGRQLLDKVAQKANSYKNICADFVYDYENLAEEKTESQQGTLLIKGKKFHIDFEGTSIFSDGKSRWVYLKESNEVTITKIETKESDTPEDRLLSDPMSLFSYHKNGFKYLLVGTEMVAGKQMQVAEISPINKNQKLFKVKYWIDANNNLYQIKCFQKDGTRITLTLNNMKVNQKVEDSNCTFNASQYPDVEVIDMRD